ncbi:transcriptional regulator, TetR family [Amycolatopsis marina]|uniref:Transcriptional regulator, TetR family n=1 Tax=Amycolatopsis marina TaxID=490629 RepID=A0A1I1BSM3_9PSEU|nr:TetR/AcrR family transcriptional regulator [Amycolatopsis marina]SFB51678.1 transcriptional regulator, TetR family [Amycolatopsis marina]
MSTRDKILDAAAELIGDRGLARATTKEIAKAAGYSEGTLYKHFDSKTDLFVAVLAERAQGDLGAALRRLHDRGDQDDLATALRDVAVAAVRFYRQGFPMAASLFAEPDLLAAHRADLAAREVGPHLVVRALSGYLADCRERGEVAEKTDVDAAAAMLLGACFQRAFLAHFTGPDDDPDSAKAFAASLVNTMIEGIGPSR